MRNFKRLGIVPLSTVLSFGILAPTVGAAPLANEHPEKIQIRIAEMESTITKTDLIEKVKTLFPGKFDFLKDSDFHMSSGHHYPDDETIRYDLSFHKELKGKQIYGSFGFIGEDLEIENFYYEPASTSDALFPPKVTKQEAQEAATAFLNKFSGDGQYQLDNTGDYYSGNQTLIEPIRYSFSFVRTENKIPVSDQRIQVTVLGSGEIVEFYRYPMTFGQQTYADATKVLPKEEILKKVKENLSIDLQYTVDFKYQTGEPYVKLSYQPTSGGLGINALSGDWKTASGFSSDLPEEKGLELITTEPLEPRETDFSVEKAKKFAQELLAIDSDKVKLIIESISERENYKGQDVIAIQYMYESQNGGHGTELELDRQTGEIIQYYDIKRDVLGETGEENESGKTLSTEEALKQAVEYLKEYSPSYLHNYAIPQAESHFEEGQGLYHFTFPRVVDGILVNGDQISVSVSTDGSLRGLTVDQQNIENWPSTEEIISQEAATAEFMKQLNLDLRYMKETEGTEDNHYHLVYLPVFNGNLYSSLDAVTGEWNRTNNEEDGLQSVSHPWAEKELNYLLHAGILEIEDDQAFDANEQITKGDAIEIVMKSLTPFYEIYYSEEENGGQSFDNIDPEHPLYLVIERAVAMGILETEESNFDENAPLTREELAVWYVRALGLEQAAEHSGIYQLKFADAKKVQDEYIGYVALANSLGLITTSNGRFNPDGEVTYAQLSVSIFRLAKEVYEGNPRMYY